MAIAQKIAITVGNSLLQENDPVCYRETAQM